MSTQGRQIEKAIRIALDAHSGQADKGGDPYILHPLRLMNAMETDEERMVAVLHDVVEDSDVTLEDLSREGFSEEVVRAVGLLTKQDGDTYEMFIERVRHNELACRVKLADLKDNMRIERIPNPTQKDRDRIEKYKKAVALLESC